MKRSPLARRTPLQRGTASLRRTGWLKPSRKRRERTPAEWTEDLGACVVCPLEGGTCSGPVQGHHAIGRQQLCRLGVDRRFLFDTRNRVPVCEFRHEQHTTGYKPIPRGALPASVFEFASELALDWWIDKHYAPSAVAACPGSRTSCTSRPVRRPCSSWPRFFSRAPTTKSDIGCVNDAEGAT